MNNRAVKPTASRCTAALLAVLFLLLTLLCCSPYRYHAKDADLQSDASVTVQAVRGGVLFDGPGDANALVFYPGAQVE